MKKFAAILLIALFLFNLFGYRVCLNYMQRQADVQMEASLDSDNYNDAELLTIKVPLSLPYQNNQADFVRVNGEITVKGKIYKYVKRKVSDGNLVLLCLPDHNKMRIESAKDEFFKYANDLVQNQSKKQGSSKTSVVKNLAFEFELPSTKNIPAYPAVVTTHGISGITHYLPTAPHSSPEQPPELA